MCRVSGSTNWELLVSATKRVQPSHSLKHIFLTKYPQKPRIGYLWSVGPLLFLHIFISSVRIVVGLCVNFERRWIHQSLKTCVSENWMKWGQMFIKYANMILKSFVVIRSIRTCKFCSTQIFLKNMNAQWNDENTGFNITVVGTIFTKEADQFTPFLKFGSAAKDPKLAFALTMAWENSINGAIRRIYSPKCDHFLGVFIFFEKEKKTIQFFFFFWFNFS